MQLKLNEIPLQISWVKQKAKLAVPGFETTDTPTLENRRFLPKFNTHLPYYQTIKILGIYL